MRISISSSRHATAGVRISIDHQLGPLFGLNASGRSPGHDYARPRTHPRPTPRPWLALARAAITMARIDLWHAQLALKTLRRDQREAMAEAAED